ncbi:transposase [Mycobacterium sp.]|uniref:transposase n=1 Tax=Mycobacterium sp. TaxID=1785 RepID=UPI001286B8AE|nr:MAG: transposase [Mycobacterium sp.]
MQRADRYRVAGSVSRYASALHQHLPQAVGFLGPFHVTKLTLPALGRIRRRAGRLCQRARIGREAGSSPVTRAGSSPPAAAGPQLNEVNVRRGSR